MDKSIAEARTAVNAETFGTPAWESAMQVVRGLVAEQMAEAPRGEYTSVDGDVFNLAARGG
jgi:hypothetical protein